MLTLKEELFVKPFQQKLFRQHKIKVSIYIGPKTKMLASNYNLGTINNIYVNYANPNWDNIFININE